MIDNARSKPSLCSGRRLSAMLDMALGRTEAPQSFTSCRIRKAPNIEGLNMVQMLCRSQAKNYLKWREVFNADANAHRAANLILRNLWREQRSRNNVYFICDLTSMREAQAFINTQDAKALAKRSGCWTVNTTYLRALPYTGNA